MSYVDYEKAQKLGLKAFKTAITKGSNEYLPVLDEILENVNIQSEVNLGLIQIPLDRVVGTSNLGRTYAFANNFMPILDYKTEFGSKWSELCDSHIEEGIREPIKAFEYMNKFYVVEGNKRVSVLKYFDAVTVPAVVTRKIPQKTDDLQVKIYYEFMEFNKLTTINYLWFSQEGCFKRMLELTCEDITKVWTPEQIRDFGSAHHRFNMALRSKAGDSLDITIGDAFLIFIDIYGYDAVKKMIQSEMKTKIDLLWEEILIESKGREINLKMEPDKAGKRKLADYFIPAASKKTMVAFIFDKDPVESDWLYAHELGRVYLEENFSDKVKTIKVHNLVTEQDIMTAMEDLILMGVKIMFTTSSRQVSTSLKVAVNNPEVTILNCSLNTSHKLIRTYYARLYEVKFLTGMIAGALSRNGKIGYLADYSIFGMPADVNAFALGARMVNPEAKVYLEWTTVKNQSREEALDKILEKDIRYISDQVMSAPSKENRKFGLYSVGNDDITNIAMPIYQWGIFYEKLIESIINGTFKQNAEENVAINYWWGLSAGVVDLLYSKNVPDGTLLLVETIKKLMINKEFRPFSGKIVSQGDIVRNEDKDELSPQAIMKMNWLVDNIIGEIPEIDELNDAAKSIVELKGVGEDDEEVEAADAKAAEEAKEIAEAKEETES